MASTCENHCVQPFDAHAAVGPLTGGERAAVTDWIRHQYEDAGLAWPDHVVWAPSPLAAQLAAADLAERHASREARIRAWMWSRAGYGLRFPDPAHHRLRVRFAELGPDPDDTVIDRTADDIDSAIEVALAWTVRNRHPQALRYPVSYFNGRFGDCRGCRWWPHTNFVVISERPESLHLEQGDDWQLHNGDGPAISWPDGYHVYAIHGVAVPAGMVEQGWDVQEIHRHVNTEVRRAAIELIGWTDYIEHAGWRLVATAQDPGNAPHELLLYEDPTGRLRGVRVLVMTNGSPDRSGNTLRYAETVPDTIDDPVEAAAWQYGCSVDVYRELRRRT